MTDATDLLKPGERLDYLARENLSIIQNPDYFAFSVDAILLAHFAKVPRRQTARILDLCSGTGVIPFLLSAKTAGHIDAIELQEALVDMAQRSCQLNDLTDRLTFRQGDVKTMAEARPLYDVVTCNPPYFSVTNKQTQHHLTSHAIARHEVYLTLEQWVAQAKRQLKTRGKLFCVYRPDRLDDLMETLLGAGFSVHRLQFAYGKADQVAKVVLVEAIYAGGRQGLKVEPPIIIYGPDQQYTPEMKAIYYGD